MSLLTMIQSVTPRLGIPNPLLVAGSTDDQVLQLLALANEEGQELAKRGNWQQMNYANTFTTVATASQGDLATLATAGLGPSITAATFDYLINDTLWNRTTRRPVSGPLSTQQWEQLKASNIQGPWPQYTVYGGTLFFLPIPPAGQTCAFRWYSKAWVTTGTGLSTSWVLDADTGLLPEDLMAMGIMWRWRMTKGFDYAEDFAKYERRVEDALARDGSKPVLSMDGCPPAVYPGIIVPSGNWPI